VWLLSTEDAENRHQSLSNQKLNIVVKPNMVRGALYGDFLIVGVGRAGAVSRVLSLIIAKSEEFLIAAANF
jgi:hypothetical protein